MKPGAVLIDVAIDQGGCTATSRPTTHADPTFIINDVVHYCVANMPGAVGRTSTFALCNVTLPWALLIANRGLPAAAEDSATAGPRRSTSSGARSPTGPSPKRSQCRTMRGLRSRVQGSGVWEAYHKCYSLNSATLPCPLALAPPPCPLNPEPEPFMPEPQHAPGGHRNGQRQRLAEDQGRRRSPGRIRRVHEVQVMSAHRTPEIVRQYAAMAAARGLRGDHRRGRRGGPPGRRRRLAHLLAGDRHSGPHANSGGLDSLLSTVQMPGDVPVATVGLGGGGPATPACWPSKSWPSPDADLQQKLVAFRHGWSRRSAPRTPPCKRLLRKKGITQDCRDVGIVANSGSIRGDEPLEGLASLRPTKSRSRNDHPP